ncbi:MAG: VOC family protein [Proteobacteria bacterium]|nr:VOC family protein [Pseudomonadota bacterium]MBI3498073.1 VOC family protein [Pseudomonadota bacterium]
MINPIGLDHVVLRVGDVTRAITFYCDVLGCHVEKCQEAIGLVQLRAGRSLIDLVDIAGKLGREGGAAPGAEGRNMDHLCIRVEPFEGAAIQAHLKSHGVEPGPVVRRYGAEGDGPSIYLADPDGNTVELKGPPGPA